MKRINLDFLMSTPEQSAAHDREFYPTERIPPALPLDEEDIDLPHEFLESRSDYVPRRFVSQNTQTKFQRRAPWVVAALSMSAFMILSVSIAVSYNYSLGGAFSASIHEDGFYRLNSSSLANEVVGKRNDKKIHIGVGSRIVVNSMETHGEAHCTITPYTTGYALTSGHCVEKSDEHHDPEDKKGSYVTSEINGISVGIGDVVNSYMKSDGVDVALIKLNDGVIMDDMVISNTYDDIEMGSKVTLYGSTSVLSQGMIVSRRVVFDAAVNNYTDALIQPGDSGGTVINSDGTVVGLIKGYKTREDVKNYKENSNGKSFGDGIFVAMVDINRVVSRDMGDDSPLKKI